MHSIECHSIECAVVGLNVCRVLCGKVVGATSSEGRLVELGPYAACQSTIYHCSVNHNFGKPRLSLLDVVSASTFSLAC